jgi:hypothetical protein
MRQGTTKDSFNLEELTTKLRNDKQVNENENPNKHVKHMKVKTSQLSDAEMVKKNKRVPSRIDKLNPLNPTKKPKNRNASV